MQIERRALYNALRMNSYNDPKLKAEAWQIEDYRALTFDTLFARLKKLGFPYNRNTFVEASQDIDSPEDLTDYILDDTQLNPPEQDEVYLLVFELWRRLIPEKQSFSVFCDELDHQIFSYDQGLVLQPEVIPDIIANLQVILDQNVDDGADPHEVFDAVVHACANDVESFLYDYTSEQIDERNFDYALELLEGFYKYVNEIQWFDFLRVRLLRFTDEAACKVATKQVVKEAVAEKDLEFKFDVLAFLAQGGEPHEFVEVLKSTLPILETEEDFQDLLVVCVDYFHYQDKETQEQAAIEIQNKRSKYKLSSPFKVSDADAQQLLKLIKQ